MARSSSGCDEDQSAARFGQADGSILANTVTHRQPRAASHEMIPDLTN
jgi:hypothetical protein